MGVAVNQTQRGLDRMATGSGRVIGGLARIGVVAGTAVATGLGYAAKQAISFQDAFAGVEKTVGKAEAATAGIDQALRKLSTRIPINYTDLAGIAQEAGALGVPAAKVANFTEVVARLSAATTGLTREAAAEAFGKLGNVLGLNLDATGKGYERAGSALIRLGNTAASSEGDIIEVAKRFGAAGTQAGLSGDKILGFASAIASLGVEPEAAGSALSRTFNKITTQIGTSDAKFRVLAKTSGMTAAQFKQAWATDASGAFQTFLQHLSKLDEFQAADVLKKAGITNVRDVNVILLLSQHLDTLTSSLHQSADAWKQNTEWQTVSDTRFATLQNSLIKFHNLIQVSAAAMGEQFTPALARALDKVSAFVAKHQADLVQMGKDIGKAIDDIDWTQVEAGATAVADAAKTILDLLSKIPPQIDLAVAAFLGLNKVTGGALGQVAGGAVDLVGGLATLGGRGLAGRGGRLGGVGGALSRLTSTPVYITGVAPGVSLGGIPGGGPGGVPTGGGGGFAGLVTGLLKGVVVPVAVGLAVDEALVNFFGVDAARSAAKGQTRQEQIERDLGRGVGGRGATSFRDRPAVPAGEIYGPSTTPVARMAATLLDRGGRELGKMTGKMKDDLTGVVNIQRGVWAEFKNDLRALRQARGPADVQRTVNAMLARVTGGAGDVARTAGVLQALRAQLRNTHDPQTAAILRAAINRVEAKLVAREWVQRQLAAANKIANSTESSKDKITDLTRLQRTLVNRGDTHAAAIIGKKIDDEKAKVVAAQHAAGQAAAAAIKDKDLSIQIGPTTVVVNNRVSVLETIKMQTTFKQLGGRVAR